MLKGVLNLYKPSGITSSTAVGKARRILDVKTAGHFGTLDPAGEGVLLMGIGKAARLFDFFLKNDKSYEADFTFGYQTDTLDGEGSVVATSQVIPDKEDIQNALKSFIGRQMQLPPAYSAKSIAGVRAYELARRGEEVSLKTAAIEIYDASLLSYCSPVAKVLIRCSSGTYIRSVCRDLAEKLGSVATMTTIKRVVQGGFKAEDSVNFEQLEILKEKAVIPVESVLKTIPQVDLDVSFTKRLDNGVRIPVIETGLKLPQKDFALYSGGVLYGIAYESDEKIIIKTLLKD